MENSSISSSETSSVQSVVSKSESSSTESIFDFMKGQNTTELSLNDPDKTKAEELRKFLTNLGNCFYYGEFFINGINNKEIFIGNIFGVQPSAFKNTYSCLIAIETKDEGIAIYFNAIRTTNIPDQYEIFNTNKPNEDLGIYFTVSDDKILKIITPYGNYFKLEIPIDDYINNKNLLGTYQDKDGKTYRFTSDKQAIWPDRTFSYFIFNKNYPESSDLWEECNPICVINKDTQKTTGEYFGYKFVTGKLYIYKVYKGQPFGYYIEGDPILILEKVAN